MLLPRVAREEVEASDACARRHGNRGTRNGRRQARQHASGQVTRG